MQTFMHSVQKFNNAATRILLVALCILTACLGCSSSVALAASEADTIFMFPYGNLSDGYSITVYPEMCYLDYLEKPSSSSTKDFSASYSLYRFRFPVMIQNTDLGRSLCAISCNADFTFSCSIDSDLAGYNGPIVLYPVSFYVDGLDNRAGVNFFYDDGSLTHSFSDFIFTPNANTSRNFRFALYHPSLQFYNSRSPFFYICLDLAARTGGYSLADFGDKPVTMKLTMYRLSGFTFRVVSSENVNQTVSDIKDSIIDNRNEDKNNAVQAGNDATTLVSQMNGLKSKWAILWYPIEFTNRLLSVFSSGSASAVYISSYGQVIGYRYCEETGYLLPVYDLSRASPRVGQGASITFPSFEILGETVWDSYTFDLTQIKSWFPELFNLLYVAISILELYWFVSFLRDKYDEVFGS